MAVVNPVPVFDFVVTMMDVRPGSGGAAGAGDAAKSAIFSSFAEVSGIDAEMEIEEYRAGGINTTPLKFPKWGKYPNLIFKRGVTANPALWDWYHATIYRTKAPVRKNGIVMLTDRSGGAGAPFGGPRLPGLPAVGSIPAPNRTPVAAWYFKNALPERLRGPMLNAKNNEIAIETLELSHEGLFRLGSGDTVGRLVL